MSSQKPKPGRSLLDSGLPVLEEWDWEKNSPLTPSDVYPKAKDKVWWKCEKGHPWRESLNNRSKGKGCPYCSGRRCIAGENDLKTLYPEIHAQIAYPEELDESPEEVHPGSTKKLIWKCEKGHEWPASIRTRVKGHGCPFCSKRMVASGENDLGTSRPELIQEWATGNPPIETFSPSSPLKVRWNCKKSASHQYSMSVSSRVSSRSNPCLICNLRTFVPGENDLRTLHPSLASEWSKTNSLSPRDYMPNSKVIVAWECHEGHKFEMSIRDRAQKDKKCPTCIAEKVSSEKSAQLFQKAQDVAKKHGGTVRRSESLSMMSKLEFTCKEGHVFSMTIRAVVVRGGWCVLCRLGIPENQEQASNLLALSGYQLLTQFASLSERVTAKCLECGDERTTKYYVFRDIPCSHVNRSKASAQSRLEDSVADRGGILKSNRILSLSQEYSFICADGHEFTRTGSAVVSGSWCRECSAFVTESKIRQLISSRGGVLISELPQELNGQSKIMLRCSRGHEFENDWNHMAGKRRAWCQICSKGSKSEEIARTTFKQLFGKDFKKRRPKWLINNRGRQMELDGFEPELGIAFEYQGRQHFEDVGVYRMGKKLAQRKLDDETKRRLCAEHGVHLVELRWDQSYEDFASVIRDSLGDKASEFGVDWRTPINIEEAFIRDDRLDELRDALATRGLILLSKKWIDVSYRYKIKCGECGHSFNQSARSYLNSRGVAGCKKCAMKKTAALHANRLLGFEKLEEIARRFEASVVSTTYVDVKTTYEWKCNQGHSVRRTIPSIAKSGHLCLECNSTRDTMADLVAFADSFGGRLLSPKFSKFVDKYEWECKNKHLIVRSWSSMKGSKSFCHTCTRQERLMMEMRLFASERGAKLVSETAKTGQSVYRWSCSQGHTFERSYGQMKHRNRFNCPECRHNRGGATSR